MKICINGKDIFGLAVDPQTRCSHYHRIVDVVAIQFKCCQKYYSCYFCHQEIEGHPVEKWSADELERPAVFCGVCGNTSSIRVYLTGEAKCPFCDAFWNPKCREHFHYYFELDSFI